MKDRSGQGRIGGTFREDIEKMLRQFCSAGGDHRHTHGAADGCCESQIETGLRAVAIDRSEKNFARAHLYSTTCPILGVPFCSRTASAHSNLPEMTFAPCVDSQHHGLRPKFARQFTKQRGTLDRRRVHRYLVRPGAHNGAGILERSDAATGSERYGELLGNATDGFEECGTIVAGRGNIEHHEFVGALGVVAHREFYGVTGVAETFEMY